jgi:hypothetical protein
MNKIRTWAASRLIDLAVYADRDPQYWPAPDDEPGTGTSAYRSTWLTGPGTDSRPPATAAETAELNQQARAAEAVMTRELGRS